MWLCVITLLCKIKSVEWDEMAEIRRSFKMNWGAEQCGGRQTFLGTVPARWFLGDLFSDDLLRHDQTAG